MTQNFGKYELPSRVALVLSYYAGREYETSEDVLADRANVIAKLDQKLAKPRFAYRLAAHELRRDLIAGHPRGSVTLQAIKSAE